MVTLSQLIAVFAPALRADTELADWCRQTWGKALLVRVGQDPGALVESAHMPAVWLSPARKSGGQTASQSELVIALDVYCASGPEKREGGPTAPFESEPAAERLEALVDLAVGVCEEALDATNCSVNTWDVGYDFVKNAPLATARVLLTVTVPTVIGGEVELTS